MQEYIIDEKCDVHEMEKGVLIKIPKEADGKEGIEQKSKYDKFIEVLTEMYLKYIEEEGMKEEPAMKKAS